MLKTHLITIAQENKKNAKDFVILLQHLHESITGKKVAFEIVVFGQNIGFCFTAQPHVAEVVKGEIYAMNPQMDIQEIPDFSKNIQKEKNIASTDFYLDKSDIFPLKTVEDFSGNSMSGILNIFSGVQPGEGAWMQVVITPKKDNGWTHFILNWKKRFFTIAKIFWIKYWFKKGMTKSFFTAIDEKISHRLFSTSIKISTFSAKNSQNMRLQSIIGAMQNFNTLDFNQIHSSGIQQKKKSIFAAMVARKPTHQFLLSSNELAALFHLPNEQEVPNIIHVLSKKAEPPADLPIDSENKDISFFGQTNFHGKKIPFGIHRNDRRRHLYTVGKSGSGKSKFLELLIQKDIQNEKGVAVLDPHGDLIDNILKIIPQERIQDVIIFDPSDTDFPICFNPLADVPPELKIRVSIGIIEIFKKLFGTNWSPKLEHVLRYTLLALLDTPNTTILSILKMLTDKNYRQSIVQNIQDNVVKNFWTQEFASWSEKFDAEAITPLLNKVGQFVATNMIRNIVGQPQNTIDFREVIDRQKILLLKISKGILGEENASLLGSMIITKIYQAAMSRADTPEEQRKDFYFYVDEFQNFATDTFDEILSEARKYRLNLTIAHQFLGQLSSKIRTTVFGNVGSMVSFRVGGEDAKILEGEYTPRFSQRDCINLGVREFQCKISIHGEIREAFSGRTLDMKFPENDFSKECIHFSREKYCKSKKAVEEILTRWEEGAIITNNQSLIKNNQFPEPIL